MTTTTTTTTIIFSPLSRLEEEMPAEALTEEIRRARLSK